MNLPLQPKYVTQKRIPNSLKPSPNKTPNYLAEYIFYSPIFLLENAHVFTCRTQNLLPKNKPKYIQIQSKRETQII